MRYCPDIFRFFDIPCVVQYVSHLFQLDTSGNGFIDLKELKDALDSVGYKIPQWKVRENYER